MLQFRYYAHSDTGPVREHNEDAGYANPYLLCLADGVGGEAAGEVASATATYVVSARALAHPGHNPLRLLATAVAEAHRQLVIGVEADPSRAGMATTLTAILTDGVRTGLAHVGDSRAYLLRDGELTRISHDQTLVQAMVDAGRLTPEEAAASPYRSVVAQALDARGAPEPDLIWLDLRPGDRLLVCSDGLTDYVPDATIAALLATTSLQPATDALVQAAFAGRTRDNVTVIVADVVDEPAVASTGWVLGAVADPRNLVDPAAVRPLRSA